MIIEHGVSYARVKQLIRYTKKYAKFGAYVEVEETTLKQDKTDHYKVTVHIPKIHIDKFGNMAVAKGYFNAK